MKTNPKKFLIAGALLLTASGRADEYSFSYDFSNGPDVTGDFAGSANGDVITIADLPGINYELPQGGSTTIFPADMTMSFNGTPVQGFYGNFFASGQLSFDGLENNFTLENGSSTVPGYPPTTFFGSNGTLVSSESSDGGTMLITEQQNATWNVVDLTAECETAPGIVELPSQSVPEGGSVLTFLMIAVLGLFSLSVRLNPMKTERRTLPLAGRTVFWALGVARRAGSASSDRQRPCLGGEFPD